MARAFYECPKCGDHVEVIARNRREADYFAAARQAEGRLCRECWQAEQADQHAADAADAEAAGLPALTGSAKQIAWAESIRAQKIQAAERFASGADEAGADWFGREKRAAIRENERLPLAIEAMKAQTAASWWIDCRNDLIYELLADLLPQVEELSAPGVDQEAVRQAEAEAKIEATVRPESPVTETVAEIRVHAAAVEVEFPERNEDFRQLVRFGLGYTWNAPVWRRELNVTRNGQPADRAAELGHRLLGAGFPVRIFDETIRAAAVSGQFQPEQTRWVTRLVKGDHAGWFAISWGRSEDFYRAAKAIRGARYDKPRVIVPPEHFEEVIDFAEMHGFSLSEAAQELAAESRQARDRALVAHVEPQAPAKKVIVDTKPQQLDVPQDVDVDPTLKDEG